MSSPPTRRCSGRHAAQDLAQPCEVPWEQLVKLPPHQRKDGLWFCVPQKYSQVEDKEVKAVYDEAIAVLSKQFGPNVKGPAQADTRQTQQWRYNRTCLITLRCQGREKVVCAAVFAVVQSEHKVKAMSEDDDSRDQALIVNYIATSPEFRRLGLAKLLTNRLKKLAVTIEAKKPHHWVMFTSVVAPGIPFWSNMGFVPESFITPDDVMQDSPRRFMDLTKQCDKVKPGGTALYACANLQVKMAEVRRGVQQKWQALGPLLLPATPPPVPAGNHQQPVPVANSVPQPTGSHEGHPATSSHVSHVSGAALPGSSTPHAVAVAAVATGHNTATLNKQQQYTQQQKSKAARKRQRTHDGDDEVQAGKAQCVSSSGKAAVTPKLLQSQQHAEAGTQAVPAGTPVPATPDVPAPPAAVAAGVDGGAAGVTLDVQCAAAGGDADHGNGRLQGDSRKNSIAETVPTAGPSTAELTPRGMPAMAKCEQGAESTAATTTEPAAEADGNAAEAAAAGITARAKAAMQGALGALQTGLLKVGTALQRAGATDPVHTATSEIATPAAGPTEPRGMRAMASAKNGAKDAAAASEAAVEEPDKAPAKAAEAGDAAVRAATEATEAGTNVTSITGAEEPAKAPEKAAQAPQDAPAKGATEATANASAQVLADESAEGAAKVAGVGGAAVAPQTAQLSPASSLPDSEGSDTDMSHLPNPAAVISFGSLCLSQDDLLRKRAEAKRALMPCAEDPSQWRYIVMVGKAGKADFINHHLTILGYDGPIAGCVTRDDQVTKPHMYVMARHKLLLIDVTHMPAGPAVQQAILSADTLLLFTHGGTKGSLVRGAALVLGWRLRDVMHTCLLSDHTGLLCARRKTEGSSTSDELMHQARLLTAHKVSRQVCRVATAASNLNIHLDSFTQHFLARAQHVSAATWAEALTREVWLTIAAFINPCTKATAQGPGPVANAIATVDNAMYGMPASERQKLGAQLRPCTLSSLLYEGAVPAGSPEGKAHTAAVVHMLTVQCTSTTFQATKRGRPDSEQEKEGEDWQQVADTSSKRTRHVV